MIRHFHFIRAHLPHPWLIKIPPGGRVINHKLSTIYFPTPAPPVIRILGNPR